MNNIEIQHTKVLTDIVNAVEDGFRIIIEEGSSRSSKTWSNFQFIFGDCLMNPKTKTTVLRETAVDCCDIVESDWERWVADPCGRMIQFEKGEITLEEMDELLKVEDLNRFMTRNRTKHIWTFDNGSSIRFTGLDKISKVMGMTQTNVWLNEPYSFSEGIYKQLAQRTSKLIIIDWNPMQDHWIEGLKSKKNCIVLHSTFLDNPFCPEEARNQILSYQMVDQSQVVELGLISEKYAFKYDLELNALNFTSFQLIELERCLYNQSISTHIEDDRWHWLVFGKGLKSERPNRIFKFKPIPVQDYFLIDSPVYYGVDWGEIDPFGIVEVKYKDGNLYLHELNYDSETIIRSRITQTQEQQMNSQGGLIVWLFNMIGIDKKRPIVCDSNEGYKEKILKLRQYGYEYAVGAKKPPGSRLDGISTIRKLQVFYTHTSKNIQKEQELFSWMTDRMGNVINEPEDANNHICFDPVNYVTRFLKEKGIINIV